MLSLACPISDLWDIWDAFVFVWNVAINVPLSLRQLIQQFPPNTNFILENDEESKTPQQHGHETYPSCSHQLGIQSRFSRQCNFLFSSHHLFPSFWHSFLHALKLYLELHISKGSCSTTLPKTAYMLLLDTTDNLLYSRITFTLDWNL